MEKLLCPERFLARRSRMELNCDRMVAATKTIDANTHPHLLTVKGSPRMPDPMTVLMMVVTVSRKSA